MGYFSQLHIELQESIEHWDYYGLEDDNSELDQDDKPKKQIKKTQDFVKDDIPF